MNTCETDFLHIMTVHFNTPALTSQLIRSLPRRTPKGLPVLIHVLDNSSEPHKLSELRANLDGLEGVVLVISNRNLGFGDGINLLVRRGNVEPSHILWFLNPDTLLDPDCLKNLEAELDFGEFDVLSPLIYSGIDANQWIWYCGGSIRTRDIRVEHQLYGSALDKAPPASFETEFVTGAAPMMRASAFHAAGGFPDRYFLYWEDTYFSWKARSIGLRLGVVPAARLWHAVGASSGSGNSETFFYWATRNRFTFARDIGFPRRHLISGTGGLQSLRAILRTLKEPNGRYRKIKAAVRGTLDGFRTAGPDCRAEDN